MTDVYDLPQLAHPASHHQDVRFPYMTLHLGSIKMGKEYMGNKIARLYIK